MKPDERLEFTAALESLSNALKQNDKFPLPILVARAERQAYLNPMDSSLAMTTNVLKKIAANKLFITRAELNEVYEQFYKAGSKVKEIFAEELDRPELSGPTYAERDEEELSNPEEFADKHLLNALKGAFNGKDTGYSEKAAESAVDACKLALASNGYTPHKVYVFDGNEEFIICNASFITSRGSSNILIPVELSNDRALYPTLVISSRGFADLTKEAVHSHLRDLHGKTFEVNAAEVFKVLKVAKHGLDDGIDDIDLAIAKLNGAEHPEQSDGIFLRELDDIEDPIDLHGVELSDSDQKFADSFANPRGQAEFLFGKEPVAAGSSYIQRKLADLGHRMVQVAVSEVTDNAIGYKVAVGNKSFSVPVKVENGRAVIPEVVVANGKISGFDAYGVSEVLSGNFESAASFSPSYELSSGELLGEVKKAIASDNRALLDEVMSILQDRDMLAYKTAFDMVLESNNPMKKAASASKCGCSKVVKIAASSQPYCGHLMVPLNKVIQDSNGYCRPAYRQGMSEQGQDDAMLIAYKLLGI